MSKHIFKAAFLAALLAVGGVTALMPVAADATGKAMILPVDPTPLIAETDQGERQFTIEVADDVGERSAGLMFRESMPDDRGMLFVFDQPQQVAFWMKNTPLPLDMIFIGQDGVVRAIKQGEPLSEAVVTPGEPVRFVLEFKAGTAGRAGIRPGTSLRHPIIDQAPGAANDG
ncbi:MAG: DUF192 domain-containing protein [Rhizobiaceae bacterium]|nr:DUF192 domain-containing protein [Rhizobiaceae bacterium]